MFQYYRLMMVNQKQTQLTAALIIGWPVDCSVGRSVGLFVYLQLFVYLFQFVFEEQNSGKLYQ